MPLRRSLENNPSAYVSNFLLGGQNETGRAFKPQKTKRGFLSRSLVYSLRSGIRLISVPMAICPSIRARAAPKQ